jgi:predicted PhzF superfamily epimerase YddE/YHI9
LLTAKRNGLWIELDFPSTPPQEAEPLPGLVEALGVSPVYVGRSKFDYLIQVATEEEVRRAQPVFENLRSIPARGVILTSSTTEASYDFVSRFFAPAAGVNEDPVTGSAHCCLAPHWGNVTGKNTFVAYQASARGGEVRVQLSGDRVILGGQAVTVLRGELT